MLTYDPNDLIRNRDMIRSVQCLGCEKHYEVKFFLNHCKDCRLTNGVPPFIEDRSKSIFKTDLISCDHSEAPLPRNSCSSSPKNTLEESRLSFQKNEIVFNPEEELGMN